MSEVHEEQQSNPKVESALRLLSEAFKSLAPEEKQTVKEFQSEVDQGVQNGTVEDTLEARTLEFCYSVKFSGERIKNVRLRHAADQYIAAIEE